MSCLPLLPLLFFFLTIKYLSLLRNCQPLLKASRLWPLGPRWSESFPVWVRAFHLLHFLMSPKKAVRLSPWCPLETGSFCVGYPLPSLSLTSVLLRDFPGPVSVPPSVSSLPPHPLPAGGPCSACCLEIPVEYFRANRNHSCF